MRKSILYILLLLLTLSSCVNNKSVLSTNKYTAKKSSPSGKYRNPTIFSKINPFQGRAKAKLNKSKRKKFRLFKKKKKQRGTTRKGKKPGSSFNRKRKVSRKRLKSSGSRSSSGGGKKRKNKDLFKTRKK
ncbi:MAG: hypothetical protein RJQ00_11300 [Vicingaceae bacterium]